MPEVLQELPSWLIAAALAALLAAVVYAITKGYTIELWPPRFTAPESRRWVGSPGTHDDELLTSMINDALETVCRAVCVPSSPRETRDDTVQDRLEDSLLSNLQHQVLHGLKIELRMALRRHSPEYQRNLGVCQRYSCFNENSLQRDYKTISA